MSENNIATLAGEAYNQFERAERPDGESFTRLKDGAPGWLTDLVHEAHGDLLPDDWRYESIRAALGWIHDNDGDEDSHEFADGNIDTYNGERSAWLSSDLSRAGYVDEACEAMGADGLGIFERIGLGQYEESQEVYASVWQSLEDQVTASEDGDDA